MISRYERDHSISIMVLMELSSIISAISIDNLRIKLASKGNSSDQILPLVFSTILAVPTCIGYWLAFEIQAEEEEGEYHSFLILLPLSFLGIEMALIFITLFALLKQRYQSYSLEASNSSLVSSMDPRDPHE